MEKKDESIQKIDVIEKKTEGKCVTEVAQEEHNIA